MKPRKLVQRHTRLKRKYGLTPDQYNQMLVSQNYQCKICGITAEQERYGTFHVDHDHQTGKVRGLLCHNCNMGLGHYQDDPQLCRVAAAYLEAHS